MVVDEQDIVGNMLAVLLGLLVIVCRVDMG